MGKLLLVGAETERLSFRKIVPSDFETWLPFHQDPRSTQYWEGIPKDPFQACTEQFQRLFDRYEKNLGGMNALIKKDTNQFIGICGLLIQSVDEVEELEIGYSILPEYWKNGYASEAAIKCREYAFEHKLSTSLISIIHVDNLPSKKVARNNGMILDKRTVYKNNPVEIFRVKSK
ncbi:GNAT family N-acetyltransferase [Muriicola sp. Z0-33]|uniref:GNAT family N-acetyltransferase n=1 Tax=Muriicola sp. Z0-33 TaxID=2816957 RepID=UPI00223882E0|nr:GNAT family N-acetyltransferase [Muriicola sp. Z0-33]MCW5518027.1 GNAT family N-acetyltransferase [Muriicola sp. Z0-33]